MALLTPDDYAAIRAALETTLDANLLPDDVIALSIYADAAELEVLRRDPGAESRSGNEAKRVKNAAIYYCAALIAPAVPAIIEEVQGEESYRRTGIDWPARARELRARADDELAQVLETDPVTAARPTMFGVASGRRGR